MTQMRPFFSTSIAFDSAMVAQSDQATGKKRRILSPKLGPQEEGKKGGWRRVDLGFGIWECGCLSSMSIFPGVSLGCWVMLQDPLVCCTPPGGKKPPPLPGN